MQSYLASEMVCNHKGLILLGIAPLMQQMTVCNLYFLANIGINDDVKQGVPVKSSPLPIS